MIGRRCRALSRTLSEVAQRMPVIWPIHPRTRANHRKIRIGSVRYSATDRVPAAAGLSGDGRADAQRRCRVDRLGWNAGRNDRARRTLPNDALRTPRDRSLSTKAPIRSWAQVAAASCRSSTTSFATAASAGAFLNTGMARPHLASRTTWRNGFLVPQQRARSNDSLRAFGGAVRRDHQRADD